MSSSAISAWPIRWISKRRISKIGWHVETRKVIFNVSALNKQNIDEFLNFELKTLKFKNTLYKEDIERIKFIEKSLNEKELVNS